MGNLRIENQIASVSRDRLIHYVCLILILVSAIWIRFLYLDTIPGLEHDEALICLGSRAIYEGSAYPLTGDKVYESPLLEYAGALSYRLLGDSAVSIRYVLAILGILGIGSVYLLGKFLFNELIGLIAAGIMTFAPWAIASSRVIYASNMVIGFLPLSVYLCIRAIRNKNENLFLFGCFFIGMSACGRITVLFFGFPMMLSWIVRNKFKPLTIFLAIAVMLLPLMPVIVFNSANGWPFINVFLDPVQNHALSAELLNSKSSDTSLRSGLFYFAKVLDRLPILFDSVQSALDTSRFWIDIQLPRHGLLSVLWIFTLIGLLFAVTSRFAFKLEFLSLICLPCILIPLTTKTIKLQSELMIFHPHYLDMIMPWVFLLTGYGFFRSFSIIPAMRRVWFITTFFIITVIVMFLDLSNRICPLMQINGGPGRWNSRFEKIADEIDRTIDERQDFIAINRMFGHGLPQLTYLLPDYHLRPYIGEYEGFALTKKAMLSESIITFESPLVSMHPLFRQILDRSVVTNLSNDLIRSKSPGILCNALVDNLERPGIRLIIDDLDSINFAVGGHITDALGEKQRFVLNDRTDIMEDDPTVSRTLRNTSARYSNKKGEISRHITQVFCNGHMLQDQEKLELKLERIDMGWYCTLQTQHFCAKGQLLGSVMLF